MSNTPAPKEKYIDSPFKGSAAYNCVMGATLEQLECRLPFANAAVAFHTYEKNGNNILDA